LNTPILPSATRSVPIAAPLGLPLASIEVLQPSLDDVFLTLTGRPSETEPTEEEDD